MTSNETDPAPSASTFDGRFHVSPIAAIAVLAVVAVGFTMWPILPSVLFGALLAHLSQPVLLRAQKATGAKIAAVLITGLSVVAVFIPLILLVIAVYQSLLSLFDLVQHSENYRDTLQSWLPSSMQNFRLAMLVDLFHQHVADSLSAAGTALNTATSLGLQAFLVFVALHTFLLTDHRLFAWCAQRMPLSESQLRRFLNAFYDTGHSVVVGIGGTSLIQGLLATITYVAMGIPYALLLGTVTMLAALIPSFGTAIVWVPVAIVLWMIGNTASAIILLVVGTVVIGSIDNLMRPFISNRSSHSIPTAVVLLSMFGGLATFGGWGLLLGPLMVRMAIEALDMLRESRAIQLAVQR